MPIVLGSGCVDKLGACEDSTVNSNGLGQGWELADATLIKMLGEANQT